MSPDLWALRAKLRLRQLDAGKPPKRGGRALRKFRSTLILPICSLVSHSALAVDGRDRGTSPTNASHSGGCAAVLGDPDNVYSRRLPCSKSRKASVALRARSTPLASAGTVRATWVNTVARGVSTLSRTSRRRQRSPASRADRWEAARRLAIQGSGRQEDRVAHGLIPTTSSVEPCSVTRLTRKSLVSGLCGECRMGQGWPVKSESGQVTVQCSQHDARPTPNRAVQRLLRR